MANYIFAIDPGTTQSAWVCYSPESKRIIMKMIESNESLLTRIRDMNRKSVSTLAIEMVASYGMPVGREVFETCVWIGRFVEAAGMPFRFIYRMEVKMHLCHNSRAKDSNIRQAILDRYPQTGGGKTPQVGTAKKPGPLFGFKKDLYSALGVAIVATETQVQEEDE